MLWKKRNWQIGEEAEARAKRYLCANGLSVLAENFCPPGRGMADLDLVMQEPDGTVVFVEVKMRRSSQFGGGALAVDRNKQWRLVKCAQYFLMSYAQIPDCRFDVVVFDGGVNSEPLWLKGAFEVQQ